MAMKKRESTKPKNTKAAAADSSTSATTSKTGEKRQLPLDFSRHAVQVKKISPSQENATNITSPSSRWKIPPSTSAPSLSNPPVIRVNLVASRKCRESLEEGSAYSIETETKAAAGDWTGNDEDQDCLNGTLNGDGDDEDDSDDSAVVRRRKDYGHLDRDADCENDSLLEIKAEDTLDVSELLQIKPEPEDENKNALDQVLPPRFRWKTVYVAAFELALDTVLPEESSLFTDEEHSLFETYRELPDDPKHLFVRLFLRNQKYWQRQSKLEGRYREIEDLKSAIQQLITAGLLIDQSAMQDPEEALVMLTMDELKILARRIGILEKLSGIQRMLLAPGGAPDGEGKGRKTGLATHIFSGDPNKRDNALVDRIIDISGPCIKIFPNIMKVFERLHLVFYRAREYSERPALLEAILAKIGQRTFPTYDITRTSTVFPSRDTLLKYEAALKLYFDLSEMIESAMGPGKDAVVYVKDGEQDKENGGPNIHRRSSNVRPVKKPESESGNGDNNRTGQEEKDPERERRRLEVIKIYEKVIQEAEGIRDAWRSYVATETEMSKKSSSYFLLRFSPGWVYTQILRLEMRALAFLKRFEEESILLHELLDQHIYSLGQRGGWYERLALIKSNYAYNKRLGKQEALQVCMMALRDKHVHAVDATLIQARIVRLETELKVPFRDRHNFSYLELRKAQKRILTGERLNTPGTAAPSYASSHGYSYVPSSMGSSHPIAHQRPLWRNIDGSECSVEELALSYYGTLGYRGYHSENSILSTLFGLLLWDILFSPQPGVFETSFQSEPLDLRTDAFFLQRQDMIMERIENIAKSKILDESEVSFKTTVESAAIRKEIMEHESLEHEAEGEDEPLVNQRRQNRPDPRPADQELMNNILFEEEINQELNQAEEDPESRRAEEARKEFLARKRKECFYLNLLQKHDDLYREKKVFCVGVNWMFSKEELLQIAECIGGDALSEICKTLAQEYSKRCSGMPDLCCWDYNKKLVKFVEVKGPADRLSSKQRVWIDLLTSLGIDIELCLVQVSKAEDAFLEEREAQN
ncbi:hypothetical protein BGZ54_003195 [Gamsiella multidivaricata]|nr:hypothetical protein BGZ54_003195 [Gamsiella multidivaricata]